MRIFSNMTTDIYSNSFDFKSNGGSGVYEYDGNGSLSVDPYKGFAFEYDLLGNLKRTESNYTTSYVYSSTGERLSVESKFNGCIAKPHKFFFSDWEEDGVVFNSTSDDSGDSDIMDRWSKMMYPRDTEFCGPFIFEYSVLDKFLFDGGYCTFKDGQASFHYYLTDHLGNNRAVVSEAGTVEQTTEYYPFGGIYGDVSTNPGLQLYKYNGKEFDHSLRLDLYDYGARQYDPATMLWDRMDPLGEENPEVSPYVYCGDNPVNAIDPDGKKKVNWLGKSETGLLEKDFNDFADEFNVINIWAHGNNNGFRPRITGGRNLNKVIKTAEDFKKVIDYAKLFDKINPKNSIIVLHSCKTAEFAKKISNEGFFKENNITIIAPTENIVVTKSPQNSNSSFFTNLFDKFFGNDKPDFNYTTEVKTIIKNGEKKGKWNAYNKGRLVITYDSKEKPGSKGFNYKFINNGKR